MKKHHPFPLFALLWLGVCAAVFAAEAPAGASAPVAVSSAQAEKDKALLEAAGQNDLPAVRALLEKGANANAVGEKDDTALMRASSKGNIEMVKLLLQKGADVNFADDSGTTALMRASKGHPEAVKLLLEKGANINAADKEGGTALTAASHGHLEVVKLLLENGADINAINSNGEALRSAVVSGNIDLVRLLLSKGAKIEVPGSMRVLVESYNDRQLVYYQGYAPLLQAYDELEIFRLLLETIAARQPAGTVMPLFCAAGLGDQKSVLAALEQGASLTDKTCGYFPLSMACLMGNAGTAALLLDKGADMEGRDLFDNGPLQWAIDGGYPAVVKLLLEKGANDGADKSGITALMLASSKGNPEVVKVLLERAANVNAADKSGITALMRAASSGHSEVANLLLEKGANANAADVSGQTVLMIACSRGRIDVAEILLRHGADPNLKTSDGPRTAQKKEAILEWMIAGLYRLVIKENLQIIELLLDYGADPDIKLSGGVGNMRLLEYCKITRPATYAVIEKHMKQSGRALSNLLSETGYDEESILERLTQAQADLPDFLAHATPERKKELFSLANARASKARLYLGNLNESARVEIAGGGTGESFRKRAVVVNEYIRLLDEIKASLAGE